MHLASQMQRVVATGYRRSVAYGKENDSRTLKEASDVIIHLWVPIFHPVLKEVEFKK